MSVSKRKPNSTVSNARQEKKIRNNKIIFFSFISMGVGYYILNYVASLEKPPMGATFNILLGCTIIAVGGLILFFTIKKQYFPKKRKRSHHIFLDDLDHDSDSKSPK